MQGSRTPRLLSPGRAPPQAADLAWSLPGLDLPAAARARRDLCRQAHVVRLEVPDPALGVVDNLALHKHDVFVALCVGPADDPIPLTSVEDHDVALSDAAPLLDDGPVLALVAPPPFAALLVHGRNRLWVHPFLPLGELLLESLLGRLLLQRRLRYRLHGDPHHGALRERQERGRRVRRVQQVQRDPGEEPAEDAPRAGPLRLPGRHMANAFVG
mmetsp:Transcript_50324/g.133077  ORF Transcript_50324/g.133077 Transcript_50324/m.133077 type:complete len:214 (-) Transcript_50324:476-1117(-)